MAHDKALSELTIYSRLTDYWCEPHSNRRARFAWVIMGDRERVVRQVAKLADDPDTLQCEFDQHASHGIHYATGYTIVRD